MKNVKDAISDRGDTTSLFSLELTRLSRNSGEDSDTSQAFTATIIALTVYQESICISTHSAPRKPKVLGNNTMSKLAA